jgi:hypothetical protein
LGFFLKELLRQRRLLRPHSTIGQRRFCGHGHGFASSLSGFLCPRRKLLLRLALSLEVEHGSCRRTACRQIGDKPAGSGAFQVGKHRAAWVIRDGNNRVTGRAETKPVQRQGGGFSSTRSHRGLLRRSVTSTGEFFIMAKVAFCRAQTR